MRNTAIKSLSSANICDIIKSCADGGVSELEYRGLKVSFISKPDFPAVKAYDHNFTEADKLKEVEDDKSIRSSEVAQIEDMQRLIDDPLEWEKDQIDALHEEG